MRDDEFEWDNRKARRNAQDHGVTFGQTRLAFDDPDGIDRLDPDPDEERYKTFCRLDDRVLVVIWTNRGKRIRIYRPDRRTNMSNGLTSGRKRDKYGMTAEDWRRLDARTDEEITAAALADPDNPPLSDEELAQFRPRSLAFKVRRKLRMDRESFAGAYGIPLETLKAWERFKAEPTEVELAYLRLIEREPEMAKVRVVETAG